MKRTLSTAILMVMLFHGFLAAQEKTPFKLGLKVSPNMGWMTPSTTSYESDGARAGVTIGFIGDFYFAENYALSTGANFMFLNGSLSYSDSLFNLGVMRDGMVYRKYNQLYFEIPLKVKMQTKQFGKMTFFGEIGLGTAFTIKSTVDEDFVPSDGSKNIQQTYDNATTLMRESIIIGLGTEFHVDESSRLLFGLTYSNGLNNILKGTNYKTGLEAKSLMNYLELNIGFIF